MFTIAHEICIGGRGVCLKRPLDIVLRGEVSGTITASHSRIVPYTCFHRVDCCGDYLTLKPSCAV